MDWLGVDIQAPEWFTYDTIPSLALVLKVKKKPAQVLVLQLVSTDESANESNFYMLEYNSL